MKYYLDKHSKVLVYGYRIEGEEGNGKQKYRIFDCVIVLFATNQGGDRDNPFTFTRIIFLQIKKYTKIVH